MEKQDPKRGIVLKPPGKMGLFKIGENDSGGSSDSDSGGDQFANLDKKIQARQTIDKAANLVGSPAYKPPTYDTPVYNAPLYPGPPGMNPVTV